jgi:hypothetical protein
MSGFYWKRHSYEIPSRIGKIVFIMKENSWKKIFKKAGLQDEVIEHIIVNVKNDSLEDSGLSIII